MSKPLPPHPNLEWLKKRAKDQLDELRASKPEAQLSEAQLAVARDYGFPSWRKLKAHVEQSRGREDSAAAVIRPDDSDLVRLLAAAESGDIETVAEILDRRSELANARGPDGKTPFHAAAWSNVPQLAVLLLAAGGDPDAKYGESGHTALSWAITCHALAFAKTLVLMGHKPDLFCAAGMGALDAVRACFNDAGVLVPGMVRTGS
ncbi:MAG TPA: ankyrin repeat domain-containing protein, partial [Phycisphaerae bacterium]|nr:ankyrin repeat domain-containing protein [Phycisphaerae bacterium]